MRLHASEFPVKTIEELVLDNKIVDNVNREMLHKENLDLASGEKEDNLTFHISEYIGDELENPVAIEWSNANSFMCSKLVPGEVKVRYQFCEYLIDPNKFSSSEKFFKSVDKVREKCGSHLPTIDG